eukprot:3120233-Rhodomonas_salina.4
MGFHGQIVQGGRVVWRVHPDLNPAPSSSSVTRTPVMTCDSTSGFRLATAARFMYALLLHFVQPERTVTDRA